MQTGDTICAISSVLAPGARIIVRMSGPNAVEIATKLSSTPVDRNVAREMLSIRDCLFPAGIYRFRAPHSVTSEDVVELHIPGNVLLARWTLEECIRLGARQSDPGEFTARAYFNGKIDLSQAEGVAAAVSAHGESELQAARQLLAGELSRRLRPIIDNIAHILALVEAGIDFADEEISFIPAADAKGRIGGAISSLQELLRESSRFEPLTHLPRVVLIGRPNAGKSTLLNALAGHQRAVVSPVAGTTRDVLSAMVPLKRGSILLIDVAGLEEFSTETTRDVHAQIAADMQRRARQALETADFVVLVRAADDLSTSPDLARQPDLTVYTKCDLASAEHPLEVSALTGEGMRELRDALDTLVFNRQEGASLALNSRHVQEIQQSIDSLQRAAESVEMGAEILALELRDALDALGRIVGQVTPDDVLGRIFASFCIGK